jgi:protein-S-isoprenylcysteine O-methyltransferase Ste14
VRSKVAREQGRLLSALIEATLNTSTPGKTGSAMIMSSSVPKNFSRMRRDWRPFLVQGAIYCPGQSGASARLPGSSQADHRLRIQLSSILRGSPVAQASRRLQVNSINKDQREETVMFARISTFVYGVLCYVVSFGVFLYAGGFIANMLVPKSIDSGRSGPLGEALLINAGLVALFAVQHSVMARTWFKRAWTRLVPEPAERSTYLLFSSVALLFLFWQWRPMGGIVWQVRDPALRVVLYCLCAAGFIVALISTFLINHFDLFGLRQVYLFLVGKQYTKLAFGTPAFYRHVRHPLYLGWLFAFWATPAMTVAHLVFAIATTVYILMAIRFEERDLIGLHGDEYRRYQSRVPMILPLRFSKAGSGSSTVNQRA